MVGRKVCLPYVLIWGEISPMALLVNEARVHPVLSALFPGPAAVQSCYTSCTLRMRHLIFIPIYIPALLFS